MTDNRKVASGILEMANKAVSFERRNAHGDAENSFQMIADLWSVRINHIIRMKLQPDAFLPVALTPSDVAWMMNDLKQARALYGDPNNVDNFVDAAGYSALAGMLSLPDFPTTGEKGETPQEPTIQPRSPLLRTKSTPMEPGRKVTPDKSDDDGAADMARKISDLNGGRT